jgi:acetyl esterase/lipase
MFPASLFLLHGLKGLIKRWPKRIAFAGWRRDDVTVDEIKSLKHVMLEGGVEVTWSEMKGAVHDFFLCPLFEGHSRKRFQEAVSRSS